MKKIISISIAVFTLLTVFTVAKPASADMAFPTKTTLYFQLNSQAYDKPTEFTIDCYGFRYKDPYYLSNTPKVGTYTPELLRSFPDASENIKSYSCSSYGCVVSGYNYFSTKQGRVDYCKVNITSNITDFTATISSPDYINDCSSSGSISDSMNCSRIVQISPISDFKGAVVPSDPQVKKAQPTPNYSNEIKNTPPLNPIPESTPGSKSILNNYTIFFLFALIATIIIETLVLLALLKLIWRKKGRGIKAGNIILTGIIASALTIPYLWFVLPDFLNGVSYIAIGEIAVVLVESLIIFWILKLKWPFALLLSFICNLVSYLLGVLVIPLIIK